jgi:hypothetical protein
LRLIVGYRCHTIADERQEVALEYQTQQQQEKDTANAQAAADRSWRALTDRGGSRGREVFSFIAPLRGAQGRAYDEGV